ncbi:zinc finger protein 808-like [Argonauta hians]
MVDVVGIEISSDLQTLAKNVSQNASLGVAGSNSSLMPATPHTTHRHKNSSCELCGKVFSRYDNLERHRRIHQGEKVHQCEICNKFFAQSSYLKVHRRTHSGERPFKCNICGYAFSRSDHLVRHIRTHHAKQSGQGASSSQCTANCHSSRHFQMNAVACQCTVASCTSCVKNSFGCSAGCDVGSQLCSQGSQGKGLHPSSQSLYQAAASSSFNCNVCWKTSSPPPQSDINNGGAVLAFRCHLCGRCFSRQDNLKRHIVTHNGLKLFSCKVCNKAFSRRSYLKVHHRIHSGERPYRCSICDYAFSRSDHLIRHNKPNKGERKFSCVPLKNKGGYPGCTPQDMLHVTSAITTSTTTTTTTTIATNNNEETVNNAGSGASGSFNTSIAAATIDSSIPQHLASCMQQTAAGTAEELAAQGHQQLQHITSVPITQIFPTIQMSPSTSQIFPTIQMSSTHIYPLSTNTTSKNLDEANNTS